MGQADSVADRLDIHLKSDSKTWWRTVVVVRRPDKSPLNLSQCKFLESKLYALASKANLCVLTNKNTPQPTHLAPSEASGSEDFLDKALVIVNALGFNFFEGEPTVGTIGKEPEREPVPGAAPQVPPNLQQLLEEIRKMVTGPTFLKAEWYWTRGPDYRAKVVSNGDFRVFVRITWAKNWFRLQLGRPGEVGLLKVATSDELEKLRGAIQTAYEKAEKYLQRGK